MTQKRVLFIEKSFETEKLGIMYLAASLESAGIETQAVGYEEENVFDKMEDFCPDSVCYSVVTGEHKALLGLNRNLKKCFTFTSVWGGPHATFFSKELLSEEGVDTVVKGEGEWAVVGAVFAQGLQREFCYSVSPNLDWYQFPCRELLYDKNSKLASLKIKNFITMRNCPFSCSHCFNHSYNEMFGINAGNLRRRSVGNVVEEINEVKEKFGLERVQFIDDNFTLPPSWVRDFCEVYKKEVGLPFMCSLRADLLTDDLLESMVDAGLYTVFFAIETANERVNRSLLFRHQSLPRTIQTLEALKANGVTVRMQNMVGLPHPYSFELALDTLKFNLKHRPDFSWVSIYQPYPKTRLGEYCIERGYCNETVFDDLEDSFFKKSKLRLKHKRRTERLALWWTWVVVKRIPVFLVRILVLFSIPLFLQNLLSRWKTKRARREVYKSV